MWLTVTDFYVLAISFQLCVTLFFCFLFKDVHYDEIRPGEQTDPDVLYANYSHHQGTGVAAESRNSDVTNDFLYSVAQLPKKQTVPVENESIYSLAQLPWATWSYCGRNAYNTFLIILIIFFYEKSYHIIRDRKGKRRKGKDTIMLISRHNIAALYPVTMSDDHGLLYDSITLWIWHHVSQRHSNKREEQT